jgi:hypothetical protein
MENSRKTILKKISDLEKQIENLELMQPSCLSGKYILPCEGCIKCNSYNYVLDNLWIKTLDFQKRLEYLNKKA